MQPMRAAQKSDPDLFADLETSSAHVPLESQVVERVETVSTPPSSAPPSPRPHISLDSSSSHPVHVNTAAFGAPAIVLGSEDAGTSDDEMLVAPPPSAASADAPASRVSVVRPVLRPSNARRPWPLVFALVTLACAAAATAAWWSFIR